MSKIQWLKNDAPSLPVSTFIVDPDILIGDPTSIERKFNSLSYDIYMEFEVDVWFDISIDSYSGRPQITVREI